MNSSPTVALQQTRKPYTITKQRERWTEDEHAKFLEALKLHGRAWRRIEEYIGTKTAVQIRSHAQKFFSKLEREQASGIVNSQEIEVPPPRPKRKPSHPYPRKAGGTNFSVETENEFLPLQLSTSPSSLEAVSTRSCLDSSTVSPSRGQQGTSMKLFGKTVHVAPEEDLSPSLGSPKSGGDEESVMESGITNMRTASQEILKFNIQTSEVTSRDQEVPGFDSKATQQLVAAIQAGTQSNIPMNNFMVWHYANILAGFQSSDVGQVATTNPWQLLDPQMNPSPSPASNFQRWTSIDSTDNDYSVVKDCTRNNITDDAKRRRRRSSSSSSSSVTSSSICEDECNDVSCPNLSTTLTLERQDNDPRIGGFVRYQRPQ